MLLQLITLYLLITTTFSQCPLPIEKCRYLSNYRCLPTQEPCSPCWLRPKSKHNRRDYWRCVRMRDNGECPEYPELYDLKKDFSLFIVNTPIDIAAIASVNPKGIKTNATKVGLTRGSYYFDRPVDSSSSADGISLPGTLGLEAGCIGLSHASMVNWIKYFSTIYHSKTSRRPVIYIITDWCIECTSNLSTFSSDKPL
ncbi:hypothetical protein K502DRAFT_366478 [Neoconidiobolus thromboides FSU 785]|nr:hypothetical protein K502DRAFT_366478 [Neoconidiobolus thromboides FSU 785]